MATKIGQLPDELLQIIFHHVDDLWDLLNLRLVSHHWNDLIANETFLDHYCTQRLCMSTIQWEWKDRSDTDALDIDTTIPCTLRPGRVVSAQGTYRSNTIRMHFSATAPYPGEHIGTLSFWVYRPHLFSSQYAKTWFFPDISLSTERVIFERTSQRSRSHYIQFYLGTFPKEPQETWIHLVCTYASRKQQQANNTYFNIWVNGQVSRDRH